MDVQKVTELLVKRFIQRISVEEAVELQAWMDESTRHREFVETRMTAERINDRIGILLNRDLAAAYRRFRTRQVSSSGPAETPGWTRKTFMRKIALAAALIALTGIGISLMNKQGSSGQMAWLNERRSGIKTTAIRPMIIFPSGDTLYLDAGIKKEAVVKEGLRVAFLRKRELVWSPRLKEPAAVKGTMNPQWISLYVPYGQSWDLTLPEGSHVQVGTGSSISWLLNPPDPATRMANLQGEAWFDVHADERSPFIIGSRHGIVTATGTRFNISDYGGSGSLKVGLVTGKLKVTDGANAEVNLKEREEVRVGAGGQDLYIGTGIDTIRLQRWRSRDFDFTDQKIRQVMEQVSDWYGMNGILFRGQVDTLTAGMLGGGYMAKDLPVDSLLQHLLPAVGLKWQIEDGTIIIHK